MKIKTKAGRIGGGAPTEVTDMGRLMSYPVEWEKYEAGRFDGSSAGGRGFCSTPKCETAAVWMRRIKRHTWWAYCQDHKDALSRPRHVGQRGCGCHVALQAPGLAEVVYCSTHEAAFELKSALEGVLLAIDSDSWSASGFTIKRRITEGDAYLTAKARLEYVEIRDTAEGDLGRGA